jgi:hypothetical protein
LQGKTLCALDLVSCADALSLSTLGSPQARAVWRPAGADQQWQESGEEAVLSGAADQVEVSGGREWARLDATLTFQEGGVYLVGMRPGSGGGKGSWNSDDYLIMASLMLVPADVTLAAGAEAR